ncbi:MAG: ESX secretion-associated protein EspG [Acidimicrobiales bacterium]
MIDRSRSQLRLPVDIVSEALRQASGQGLASPLAAVRLETGGLMSDGELDPQAADLLRVIAAASLVVAVDVQFRTDQSLTTIWATPSHAVVTSSLDPGLVDVAAIRLTRLPETLSDVILLGRPAPSESRPVTVPISMLGIVEDTGDPVTGREALTAAGIAPDAVERLLVFGSPTTRRWRISSTWATDEGPRTAELRGLDAFEQGQWLMELSGHRAGTEMVFTPQGDGDVLRALRGVLPRHWVGTALNLGTNWTP